MNHGNHPFSPRGIDAPMRDVLRGLSGAVEFTEDAFKPMAWIVPHPVSRFFQHTLHVLEDATRAKRISEPDISKLKVASAFLHGRESGPEAADACANLLGFAWDYLARQGGKRQHGVFSEAIAAMALQKISNTDHPASLLRPAKGIEAVIKAGSIGLLPGMPLVAPEKVNRSATLIIFTAFLWILTARTSKADEEVPLLEMAFALSQASRICAVDISNLAEINKRLRALSEHL